MTYVITQVCCNDASCVAVCPVNCIHPTPDEPEYPTAEMLYIDPAVCIDCGACVDVCPVDAIAADYELEPHRSRYEQINADYYKAPGRADYEQETWRPKPRTWGSDAGSLRVVVIGSGPAACYATSELQSQRGLEVQVDMVERLPTPWGLLRAGVAPDHQDTKSASNTFAVAMRRKGFRFFGNVEVGRDVSHQDLLARYDALVYAVGASADRRLGIPGEDQVGSLAATDLVAWYNGHPDGAGLSIDLSAERVVIVGNGNVALDVARLLLSDPERLAPTDIADHALKVLRQSSVREVVLVGRRGPAQAAFTMPELLALSQVQGINVVADPAELIAEVSDPTSVAAQKVALLTEIAQRSSDQGRRIVLRFCVAPTEILGEEKVTGIRLERTRLQTVDGAVRAVSTGEHEDLACGLVLRSIGYRGRPVPELPFDETRAVVPNIGGRVVDPESLAPVAGVYVTGWIKRGASGVIGTNNWDARETVNALLDDHEAGRLKPPGADRDDLADLLPDHVSMAGWKAIDSQETTAGRAADRPRVKFTSLSDMLKTAQGAEP